MRYLFFLLFALQLCAPARLAAQPSVDSLKRALQSAGSNDSAIIMASIAYQLSSYAPAEGLQYAQQGLILSRSKNYAAGIAGCRNSEGANLHTLGRHQEALSAFREAVKIYEQLKDKRGLAQSLGNVGTLYISEGKYIKGLDYQFRSLKLFEELKDNSGIANQASNIAACYEQQGKFRQALKYDSIGLANQRLTNDSEGIATLLGNMGNVYLDLGETDSALAMIFESDRIYSRLNNQQGRSHNLINLSTVFSERGDYYKAMEYQFQALEICRKTGYENEQAVAYANVATYYLNIATADKPIVARKGFPATKAGLLAEAERYSKMAIEYGKKLERMDLLQYSYLILAEVQRAMHQYENAIESLEISSAYKDSLFSVEKNRKINDLENQRKLDIKESRIKLLAEENKVKSLEAAKARLTARMLLGGLLLVATIGVLIVLYYRRRRAAEKAIADERINTLLKDQELRSVSNMLEVQEEERKRIAADLHDRLGSMLSTVKLYFNSVEEQIDRLREQNQEQYRKATSLLDAACDEVRKISHNLVSGELVKFGLVSALNQLRDTINGTGQLRMDVLAFGMEQRLDSNTEISIYRIIQELVNNILKHARATNVTLQLNRVENNLNIVVEDNGLGFDVNAALEKDGMGLKNIQTRVKKLSGDISFDSYKGRGTTAIIDIPVANTTEQQ